MDVGLAIATARARHLPVVLLVVPTRLRRPSVAGR
jgi:hypothetical protein